ncbi:Fis family transcriptional regulator [Bordetella genomosp. 8]|uniref:Fis family transcriptional regulator n=1 Tax=Bordetella genomosp. 8 TaxID=1416806 RepID=A0A1W6YLX8_9BORD|nr:tripartite tricarboxylate transporter substrate binding protein [Bordetella genomosp. 8]ARP81553.1 Fis family transcriptional regulator [Bordetella genomosp. 8]
MAAILAIVPAFAAAQGAADGYPDKPIRLIVPFAPGGGTDSIARDMARTLGEKLGQAIVVENRGGGGGAIGANLVAHAAPDGYTLLFATSTFVTNAAAEGTTLYDVEKSFQPIAMIGRGPLLVVTNKDVPVDNVAQLRELALKKPNEINFCSAGNGSINHMSGELFKQRAGVQMIHVPYKGSGPATLDLLAGRVQVFFATVPTILPQVKDGRVKLLAVTSKARSPLFPDTPTMAEAGIPDFDVSTWWGVLAPAGTPPAVIAKLNAAVNDAAAAKLVSQRLTDEGAQSFKGSPADFAGVLHSELALWKGVVKQSGMKLD